MIPQAAIWCWFGIAWIFILAVLLKHWYRREHEEAAQTRVVMDSLLSDHTHQHEQDAL